MSSTAQAPIATSQMLIRRNVAEVFEAIVDPTITSRFWFTSGSGRLEVGKRIRWEWGMYGLSTQVDVKEVDRNARILLEWNGPEAPSSVEWLLEPKGRDQTFVRVRNWGFSGSADKIVNEAIGSAGGFSFVLAGMKAFLEHGIELNLVADHDPDAARRATASREA